nr:DUF421 domain-containing protein [Paenibacillus apiarius]
MQVPNWLEIAIRTFIAAISLFLITKLLGKRQITQLSVFEYVTGITIGSLAGYVSLDLEANWYIGLISLVVWVAVSLGVEFVQLKSKRIRNWIEGKPTVLIKDGQILQDNLKKERLNSDELLMLLRNKNAFKLSGVEFATMEPSGELNVLLKREYLPLTPNHLGVKVAAEQVPQVLIMDGQILEQPMTAIGRDEVWLKEELSKLGVTNIQDVYLAQIDSHGSLYIDLFDDQLTNVVSKPGAEVFAALKKCEADLELFSLSTTNKEAKAMYEQCSHALMDVITEIKPLLIRE